MRHAILSLVAAMLVAAAGPAPAQTGKSASGASPFAATGKNFQDAYNRKDAAAAATLVTNDALWVNLFGIIRSRAAIRKHLEAEFKAGWHDLRLHLDSYRIRGNTAWAVGEWSARMHGKNGSETPVHGYSSTVYVRAGNAWKIEVNTVFRAMPPKQPPQTSR